jgi:hypothetical protein
MKPEQILTQFDQFLKAKGLSFAAIAIGGVAISLLGVVIRETRDCDVLDPEIPVQIANAAVKFAKSVRARGELLSDEWLNNGPASLKKNLPVDWQLRLQPLFPGQSLVLQTLGRGDLLKTKLFAFCDRQIDRDDCLALKPTTAELIEAYSWVKEQDAHLGWVDHVRSQFLNLAGKLGYGLSANDLS